MPVACRCNAEVVLIFGIIPSNLCYSSMGKIGTYTNAAKIVRAHRRAIKLLTDNNQHILSFHSIYDYFVLLKTFNTNTLNLHQYFKDKLSIHQPFHMHNTRHRINRNFNTPLFNHSKTQKCFLYQVIPIWNSLPSSLKNYTSKSTMLHSKNKLKDTS